MKVARSVGGLRGIVVLGRLLALIAIRVDASETAPARPNFIVIYADDLRANGLGFLGGNVQTPNLDRLAKRSLWFPSAFPVSALCTPSRAQLFSGRYSSQNGVAELPAEKSGDTAPRRTRFNPGEPLVAQLLAEAGYLTGTVGKWHIDNPPASCGFQYVREVYGNGDYYDQVFTDEHNQPHPTHGHVEMANARFGREFIDLAQRQGKPFFLCYNTRAPHMDSKYSWPSDAATRARHPASAYPVPATVDGDLTGKPGYLEQSRSRTQAIHYGYRDPARVQRHESEYYSTVAELDAAIAPFLDDLERRALLANTYVIFMGDNGWFIGEHLFTSKVLAYEDSIRVPLLISGPGIVAGKSDRLALNIDIAPTMLDLAGAPVPAKIYGQSLVPALRKPETTTGRDGFLYEMAAAPDTARNPFIRAYRTHSAKLIRTYEMGSETKVEFVELYDLAQDPLETKNLAKDPAYAGQLAQLDAAMDREIEAIARGR